MKPWKAVVLMTLPVLLFAAWRIWSIYQERHEPVMVKQGPPERGGRGQRDVPAR